MANRSNFSPNWGSPPGDTIAEVLRQKGMSVIDLARHISKPEAVVRDLIQGNGAIEAETAAELARALGASADFWLIREQRYRDAVEREEQAWIQELPTDDMVRFGWIHTQHAPLRAKHLLDYFGVSN